MFGVQDACERGVFMMTKDGKVKQRRNLEAIIRTAQDIAAAGMYLHSQGILHCCLSGMAVHLQSSKADSRGFIAKVGLTKHVYTEIHTYGGIYRLCRAHRQVHMVVMYWVLMNSGPQGSLQQQCHPWIARLDMQKVPRECDPPGKVFNVQSQ